MNINAAQIRKYGEFRGADFTNTTPEPFRCTYLRNMYKDYNSQNGSALETRPGFRKLKAFESLQDEKTKSIKFFEKAEPEHITIEFGEETEIHYILSASDNGKIIEVGSSDSPIDENKTVVLRANWGNLNRKRISVFLKVWRKNKVMHSDSLFPSTHYGTLVDSSSISQEYSIYSVNTHINENIPLAPVFNKLESTHADFEIKGAYIITNKRILLYNSVGEDIISVASINNPVFYEFNNRIFILSNQTELKELVYNQLIDVVPTVPLIEIVDVDGIREPMEALNLLNPKFAVEFMYQTAEDDVADGEQYFYTLNTPYPNKKLSIITVYKNGELIPNYTGGAPNFGYTYKAVSEDNGDVKLAFNGAVGEIETGYDYIGFQTGDIIRVIAEYSSSNLSERYNPIKDCTITEVFEDKVFFSGNPIEPNVYYWSALKDPTYVPITNYTNAGLEENAITSLLTISDTLYILKNKGSIEESPIWEARELLTNDEEMAADYPCKPTMSGIGCLGQAVRFMDDPVFLSKQGLKSIGRQSVYYERAIEHRSTYVDNKMLQEDLTNAKLCEWRGYLCILCPSGNVYLADSRQLSKGQYEWFLWTDIGLWTDYETKDVYDDEEKTIIRYSYQEGGMFNAATAIAADKDKLYFIANSGINQWLCQFNTDVLRDDGTLHEIAYSDCVELEYRKLEDESYAWVPIVSDLDQPCYGRRIYTGFATIRDNVGTYALLKTLNKKGFAMFMKSFVRSGCKVRFKVDGDTTWHEMSKMFSTSYFDYEAIDYADTSYNVDDRIIVRLKKKVKKFTDISFLVYSDEINKPFGIYEMQAEYFYGGYGK